MQHRITPLRTRQFARRGFSLVELLVVVVIVGLVLSITAAATMRVLGRQKSSNTETLISMVYRTFSEQWRAVVEQAKKETVPSPVADLAGGDARRAQVIWIKLRLRQQFPMSFAEILNPATAPGGGAYCGTPPAYLR